MFADQNAEEKDVLEFLPEKRFDRNFRPRAVQSYCLPTKDAHFSSTPLIFHRSPLLFDRRIEYDKSE